MTAREVRMPRRSIARSIRAALACLVVAFGTLATHAQPAPTEIAAAELPRDLTPWGMFMSADIVVKAVMLGLLLASVVTWTIWLAKTLELKAARHSLAQAQEALAAARSLAEAVRPASAASPHVALLIQAV